MISFKINVSTSWKIVSSFTICSFSCNWFILYLNYIAESEYAGVDGVVRRGGVHLPGDGQQAPPH